MERNKLLCVHINVCVSGNLYLYHNNLISTYLDRKFKIDHHLYIESRQIGHWYLIKVDISRFRTDHSQCLILSCFSPIWVRTSNKTLSRCHILFLSAPERSSHRPLICENQLYIELYLDLYVKCLLRLSGFSKVQNVCKFFTLRNIHNSKRNCAFFGLNNQLYAMHGTYIKVEDRHVSLTIVVKVTVRFVIFIRHVNKTIIVLRTRQIKIMQTRMLSSVLLRRVTMWSPKFTKIRVVRCFSKYELIHRGSYGSGHNSASIKTLDIQTCGSFGSWRSLRTRFSGTTWKEITLFQF